MKFVLCVVLLALALGQAPAPAAPAAPAGGAAPAAPAKAQATVTEITLKDSAHLMRLIQGINETSVWVIQFHDNDPEEGFVANLKDELKNNPTLKDQTY